MATTVDVSQAKGERSYAATCHCKAMRLEVDALPERVTRCTCTNCAKRGGLWAYYKRADVRIVSDAHKGTYQWGWKLGKFSFCTVCGNSTYNETPDFSTGEPNFDNPLIVVNARLFDGIDAEALPIDVIDGRNLW